MSICIQKGAGDKERKLKRCSRTALGSRALLLGISGCRDAEKHHVQRGTPPRPHFTWEDLFAKARAAEKSPNPAYGKPLAPCPLPSDSPLATSVSALFTQLHGSVQLKCDFLLFRMYCPPKCPAPSPPPHSVRSENPARSGHVLALPPFGACQTEAPTDCVGPLGPMGSGDWLERSWAENDQ